MLNFMRMAIDIATCMYYTGLDPFTGEDVYVARHLGDRKLQRALLQFFKPENYFEVREALLKAGRSDLIGSGCEALIPSQPKAALRAAWRRPIAVSEASYSAARWTAAAHGKRPAASACAQERVPSPRT